MVEKKDNFEFNIFFTNFKDFSLENYSFLFRKIIFLKI
jgi:hypothetical protein